MSALQPPWDKDQAAINAVELLDLGYREMRSETVWCQQCRGTKRRIVRVFSGALDSGGAANFLWVPQYEIRGRVTPAQAKPAPPLDGRWVPMYGACSRCRTGVLIFYGDPTEMLELPAQFVIRAGVPQGTPARPGQETTVLKGHEWRRGPLGCWLLLVGTPAVGNVAI